MPFFPSYYARSTSAAPTLSSEFFYYKRSISGLPLLLLLATAAAGCASVGSVAARAPVVAFAEATRHPAQMSRIGREPIVLRFEPGDHIPVEFDLDSQVMRTEARPLPFEVIASRRFFVLIDPTFHLRISLDGRNFDPAPKNAFRLGLAVTREAAKVVVGLDIRPNRGG